MIDDQTCFCSNYVKVEPGLTPNGHLTASQVVASQPGTTWRPDKYNSIAIRTNMYVQSSYYTLLLGSGGTSTDASV